MFDELSFQVFEKMKSRKIVTFVTFVTSYIFFWGGVSQFWAKRTRFFSFSTFYPSARGRRELKITTPWGHLSWRIRCSMNYLFNFLKKMENLKIVSFRESKNRGIQKVDVVFEKSMSSLKILRIFLRSFLLLNDQDWSDSVFFGNVRTYVRLVNAFLRNLSAALPA